MFSGQGSQYHQMGKELYENHAIFKFWMDHCNEIVQPIIKTSLIDILYRGEGKSKPFDNLMYTNPALLCVEYSLVKVLTGMGIYPDYLMGYSLGELTASVVSGAISLEDGIQLVVNIAKLAEEKAQPSGMLTIMQPKIIMAEFPGLFHHCWLTGTNFPENFVVCGLTNTIQYLQEVLNKKNITSQILPVKYGFHTELIDTIKEDYKQLIRGINLFPIKIPIISSLKTEIIHELSENYFWEVIRNPVNFEKTVEWILEKGNCVFIDAGPSGTLATFVKYILPSNSSSISLQMINQFGKDLNSVEKLRTHFLRDGVDLNVFG
jgi:bacillaene synthase trans-acting acyltransferase